MTKERIIEIAEKMRQMYRYAADEYLNVPVEIGQDVYFDLGQFGDQQTSVTLSDDNYQFDAREILDDYFPVSASEFDEFADDLEEAAEQFSEEPDDLETVLARMEGEDENARKLVGALRAVLDAFNSSVRTVYVKLSDLMTGPLPEKPKPWPGALRPDIDYTATDFPLRFQPPPGYDWSLKGSSGARVPYTEAQNYNAAELRTLLGRSGGDGCAMVLDSKGRISWKLRGDDDLADGIRWSIWFLNRDGIPAGSGRHDGTTQPFGLDEDGNVMPPSTFPMWPTPEKQEAAKKRLVELRNFDEFGVSYDPRTVELAAGPANFRSYPEELRLGDNLNGYGRVLSVERDVGDDGRFAIRYLRPERQEEEIDRRGRFNWLIKEIVGVDRAAQPTALSLSERGAPPIVEVGYDPLTVELEDEETGVNTSDLRLGEDITGEDFGRVMRLELLDDDPDRVRIVMDRDGRTNTATDLLYIEWAVLCLANNRDETPTAYNVARGINYNPLTVPTKAEEVGAVRWDTLRLGDDVTGSTFGRVVGIEKIEDGTLRLTLNRDGRVHSRSGKPDSTYYVRLIDLPNREQIPTALSLAPEPAAEPAF